MLKFCGHCGGVKMKIYNPMPLCLPSSCCPLCVSGIYGLWVKGMLVHVRFCVHSLNVRLEEMYMFLLLLGIVFT